MKRRRSPSPRVRRRRRAAAAILVLLLIGAVVTARQFTRGGGSSSASALSTLSSSIANVAPPPRELEVDDPRTVELPTVAGQAQATAWLRGAGKRIVQFVATSADLARLDPGDPGNASATCKAVIVRLRAEGDANFGELSEIAGSAPDEDLASIVLNDIAAKGDLLRTCDDGATLLLRAGEVRFTHVVAGRLMLRLVS